MTRKLVNSLHPSGWGATVNGQYTADPFQNGGSFSSLLGPTQRKAIRALGFDGLRLCVDPGTLCAADDETLNVRLGAIARQIDALIADGLHVLLNLHVIDGHPVKGWDRAALTGADAAPFARYVDVARKVAAVVARYGVDEVTFEPFNEPPFMDIGVWRARNVSLYRAVRAILPRHRIVLGGVNYNSIDGLVALDPNDYDGNVAFTVHAYLPNAATLQGSWSYRYISRLAWPPVRGGKAKALAGFDAAVDADKSLTVSQRADLKAEQRNNQAHTLSGYFDTPQDEAWLIAQYARIANWARDKGVSPDRIWIGEVGVRGDFGTQLNATDETRALLLAAHSRAAMANGFGAMVTHELYDFSDGFGLFDNNLSIIGAVIA